MHMRQSAARGAPKPDHQAIVIEPRFNAAQIPAKPVRHAM
jgi:hypothetical protein